MLPKTVAVNPETDERPPFPSLSGESTRNLLGVAGSDEATVGADVARARAQSTVVCKES